MPCDPILLAQIRARLEQHERWAALYRQMLAALSTSNDGVSQEVVLDSLPRTVKDRGEGQAYFFGATDKRW